MYRQALKRPSNAPVSLNPKRGSQAVIRQGPPGEDTESFTHPAEYTIIYITNDNATAVRNAPHPTAPPFIWLNNFTLVEFIGKDGFSQLLQFEVNRAAYGDKVLSEIFLTNAGIMLTVLATGNWRAELRTKGHLDAGERTAAGRVHTLN